jgi:hypothetical protein
MNLKPIARWTGAAYLGIAVTGAVSFLAVRSQIYVPGDPAATLGHLTEQHGLAQFGLIAESLVVVTQALAALGFFALFRNDRPVAAFGVASFGMANALAILVSVAFNATALAVVAEPALAPAGDTAATVGLLYALSGACWMVGNIFFGLWLIPMGWFAASTRRFPRVLGWVLMVGGVGYVLSALIGVGAPDLASTADAVLPLAASVGEFWMLGYLLIFGIRPAREL